MRRGFALIAFPLIFLSCGGLFNGDSDTVTEKRITDVVWSTGDTLFCLVKSTIRKPGFLVDSTADLGTDLVIYRVRTGSIDKVKTQSLTTDGKLTAKISLSRQRNAICFETSATHSYSEVPTTLFTYHLLSDSIASITLSRYNSLLFDSNGNFVAKKGTWSYIMGGPCGSSDCPNGYYWNYNKSVTMDSLGNEIDDSLPVYGKPNPSYDALLSVQKGIMVIALRNDSTIWQSSDSVAIEMVGWSADGSRFAYIGNDSVLSVLTFQPTVGLASQCTITGRPNAFSISPDGSRIALSTDDKLVIIKSNGSQEQSHSIN